MLHEVEEGLLSPMQIVEDTDERPLRGGDLELLAEGPRDLLARGNTLLISEQGVSRLSDDRVEIQRRELLDDLHHGPVGDAVPVGQAMTMHDRYIAERCQELGRQT